MRKLFQLVGEVSIAGIDLVNKQMNNIDREARKVQRSIAILGKNMEKTGMMMSKFITAPLIAAGSALVLAADKTGKYADKLLDLTQITGLSTDKLQELEHIARIAGVDFDGLTNTIAKFTSKLPEIARGTGYGSEAIKKLGVNIYDANGNVRDMNELFPEMIKKLQGMENVTERNAIAQQIFGRSLKDIAPVLGMTAEQMDAIMQEAHDMNLIIGEDGLRAANDFRIEMEKLKAEFTKFWQRLAIDFIPTLKDTLIPLVRDTLAPAFQKVIGLVKNAVDWFGKLSKEHKETILKIVAVAAAIGPLLVIIGKTIIETKKLTSAILLMNASLLANPFVLAGIAVASFVVILGGIKKAYEDNIKAHQKWVAITTTKAQQDEFTQSTQSLIDTVIAHGDALKDVNKFTEKYGKNIDELTERARALGFVIEGDSSAKFQQLNNILMFLNHTFDETGKLVFRTKEELEKANATIAQSSVVITKTTGDSNKAVKDQIGLIKELIQQRILETDSLKAQEFQKLKLLEIERIERVTKAKETGEDVSLINELYARKRIQLERETAAKLKEIQDKNLEDDKKREEERIKLLEEKENEWKRIYQEAERQEQEHHDNVMTMFNAIANAATEFNSYMTQISDNYYQKKQNEIEYNLQKEIEAINKSTMAKEEKEATISVLEKKAAGEQKKLQKEQAKRNKAMALFSAIIGTAAAMINASQTQPFMPVGLAMMILMGILGAAQIATIASEPIPMRRGAYVKGGRGGVQAEVGEGIEDEMVLPMKTGVQALAEALINKLNEIKVPEIAAPRLAIAGGGTVTAGGAYTKSGEFHLHIGTLIADETGLKELERRLSPYRVSDQQRKGRAYYGGR